MLENLQKLDAERLLAVNTAKIDTKEVKQSAMLFAKSLAGCLDELKSKTEETIAKGVKEEHVMLSYNWKYQPIVKDVKERFTRAGIKTWFDLDNMNRNSLLESMANAVEAAKLVIIFYSEEYKLSGNCRKEAKYADKLKRKMFFIKMEPKYDPDGWLGILVEDQIYDELNENNIDIVAEKLIKDIKNMEIAKNISPDQTQSVSSHTDKSFELSNETPAEIPARNQSKVGMAEKDKGASKLTSKQIEAREAVSKWNATDVEKWIENKDLLFAKEMFAFLLVLPISALGSNLFFVFNRIT